MELSEEYREELLLQTADTDVAALIWALKKVTWNAAVHPSVKKVAEKALKALV